jgi:hypothetical protein
MAVGGFAAYFGISLPAQRTRFSIYLVTVIALPAALHSSPHESPQVVHFDVHGNDYIATIIVSSVASLSSSHHESPQLAHFNVHGYDYIATIIASSVASLSSSHHDSPQVAHFDVHGDRDSLDSDLMMFNGFLPPDVKVLGMSFGEPGEWERTSRGGGGRCCL